MRQRPLQYILFVLGVALGVAMMVSIDLANGSAKRAFQLSTDTIAGKTTHRIVSNSEGLDQAVYVNLRRDLGYELSAPVVEGYVKVPAFADQPFRVVGVDPFAEPPFRSYIGGDSLTDRAGGGNIAPFFTVPNAIILSGTLARQYGVELGDAVVLENAGIFINAPVVGLIEPADAVTERGLSSILFTDISNAQTMFNMAGQLSHVDLIVEDEAILDEIGNMLPPSARIESATASSNAVQQMVAAFELNLTALSMLALVVGMFLIYNTVTFSVVQRRKLFGILRSLGVTSGQLFTLILGEAAVLSLIGSLIGVFLGRIMIGLVTQTINDFYFVVSVQDVSVPAFSLIKGLVIGIGSALLASLAPALEAMGTSPQTSLRRSTLESKATRYIPYLIPVWGILVTIGAGLLWYKGAGLVLNFAGLFAVLIGFALLCLPFTLWFMRWIEPFGARFLGVIGRMAPRDIARSISRTAVAIAALMTAVSVIIGVSIMIGSFRGTVVTWLESILQADVFISPPTLTSNRVTGNMDPEALAIIREADGVAEVIEGRNTAVLVPAFSRTINTVAATGDVANGRRPYAWVDGDRDTLWARIEAGEGIVISEPLVLREDLAIPPEPLTLSSDNGDITLPVLGVFYDYSSDQGVIIMDDDLFLANWRDPGVSTVAYFVEPDTDVDALVESLQRQIAPIQDLSIQSNQGLRQASLEIFDRTFAVTAALQLLATVVAFIGVLSALLSLQLERARELGILRATGMTLGQLWKLTLLETGLMGATAGILAMPTGFILAWILIYVINVRSFGWTLQMQLSPVYFIQAFVVAVVAALIAGIYPSLRLGQTIIATAIRQE
jgi:putative ABC transport system permease protein